MDNYSWPSGENKVDEPLHSIQLDANAVHMQVKTGSKISNLIKFAATRFEGDEVKQITWNGSGDALSKVIACAEIMKKQFKNLYQINKIGFEKTEETWKSKLEDLRDIKVTKEVPRMCIILSKTPLDPSEPGYQTDRTVEELFFNKTKAAKTIQAGSKRTDKNAGRTSSNVDSDETIYVKKQKTRNPKPK